MGTCELLDATWLQHKASYMEFPIVMAATKKAVEDVLASGQCDTAQVAYPQMNMPSLALLFPGLGVAFESIVDGTETSRQSTRRGERGYTSLTSDSGSLSLTAYLQKHSFSVPCSLRSNGAARVGTVAGVTVVCLSFGDPTFPAF